jgi:hypothetical protein
MIENEKNRVSTTPRRIKSAIKGRNYYIKIGSVP